MSSKIHEAFDSIKADERLKQKTLNYLNEGRHQKKKTPIRKYALALTTISILLVTSLFSYDLYYTEAFYLDIDVNPSMELTLNRFDRVIATNAYNQEGKKILSDVSIKNRTYAEALKILIDEMAVQGYIDTANLFTATLQADKSKREKELLNDLKTVVKSNLQATSSNMDQDIFEVDEVTKSASHEHHVSPAKYLAITELQSLEPKTTFEHNADHSISEINELIDECKQAHYEVKQEHEQEHNEVEQENAIDNSVQQKDVEQSEHSTDNQEKKSNSNNQSANDKNNHGNDEAHGH